MSYQSVPSQNIYEEAGNYCNKDNVFMDRRQ